MRRRNGTGWLAIACIVAGLVGCAAPADAPASSAPRASEPTTAPTSEPTTEPTQVATTAPAPTHAAPQLDVDSASSVTVVVNKLRPMHPPDYAPSLVAVSTAQEGGEMVRPELDQALAAMDAAMRAAIGEGTYVTSSYRSAALQARYYQNAVDAYGQAAADTTSARPGFSEHQTGLAIDLMSTAMECRLDHCFGDTAAGQWIAAHAWEHGFLVRYPRGEDAVTGYAWEPWHVRFVGLEVSTAMHDRGVTTLEAFAGLPPAPGYAP